MMGTLRALPILPVAIILRVLVNHNVCDEQVWV